MPLTAYSRTEEREVDVNQVLNLLSLRYGTQYPVKSNEIPEKWRTFLRTDIECPCCFVTGVDVVQESISKTSQKVVRQGYFRFSSPGHKPECDFAKNDSLGFIPENLVAFGTERSNLTRVIRELVCKGIQNRAFSQKSIRDMREWFFQKKVTALLYVDLDPHLPNWLKNLHYTALPAVNSVSIPLSAKIVAMPGFDWKYAAKRVLATRHKSTLETIQNKRLWLHELSTRVESLAKRYSGENVFDPTALKAEYIQSISLAKFISANYGPLVSANKKRNGEVASCVLALSALLLFVKDWDLAKAADLFASISSSSESFDPDLGNVMGLNPFHDFKAWEMLKILQESGLTVPDELSPIDELSQIESDLREQFQT
ncbi:hypothetical protein SAMN06297229_0238 [Pseudidiomarina planktonica]|uniref:Uncharacterized protein n=1 Tax=Pseudidiomarina planktonica TaxID=1323738 RepID=A0A1Y6E9H4_9GAMM|nr:hypothetical protein [Pseudidiomarina planktonica]RUO66265.1 hypothetical protein CWI77_07545 [Pseudidiomarina planktonica]SMQ59255.1 hypothetical protein SAMN06297229_0238 [Pseudidiomarina planktonica]